MLTLFRRQMHKNRRPLPSLVFFIYLPIFYLVCYLTYLMIAKWEPASLALGIKTGFFEPIILNGGYLVLVKLNHGKIPGYTIFLGIVLNFVIPIASFIMFSHGALDPTAVYIAATVTWLFLFVTGAAVVYLAKKILA